MGVIPSEAKDLIITADLARPAVALYQVVIRLVDLLKNFFGAYTEN